MNDFLLSWLSLSFSGSLVVLTLILLKPLVRRFSKTWQYYIWLLVIMRLLIPFSPDVSIVGGLFHQAETHFTAQYTSKDNVQESNHLNLTATSNDHHLENSNPQKSLIDGLAFSAWKKHIWGALWLTVAVVLLLRKVYGYRQLLSAVKKESKLIVDGQQPDILRTVSAAMGIQKRIPVCINPFVRVPMLTGVMKPMIVLPDKEIPASELAYIFSHELTHYRRKDFLYKWLVEITVCLHWFNPLIYWVRKQMNKDCEFSCDERVVSRLEDMERQTYGETLLNSIVVNNFGKANTVSLSLNEDGKLMKERLCAIMYYKRKSRPVVFVAVVLTAVLLCGTVFAGAYTVAAVENINTSAVAGPIRISNHGIAPGGKISLGSQPLVSGTDCRVLLRWAGNRNLTILCTSSSGDEKSYSVENGKATTFRIDASDEYTIAVTNDTDNKISDVSGTILLNQTTDNQQSQNASIAVPPNVSSVQRIVYENVELRFYEGADGHPYIHDTKTNGTSKEIIGYQYGMLAFDKDGNPLKINWWSLDKEAAGTYFYLDETPRSITSAETYDVRGGWSLNLLGSDSEVDRIAYVLYCDKEISFEDGTIWTNPDFYHWRTTYEGKKIDVDILANYYPYEQKISF